MFIIRKMEVTDIPKIWELLQQLAKETGQGFVDKRTVEGLIKHSRNNLFSGLVVELQNDLIGVCLYYNKYSEWTGKLVTNIQDLFVCKKHRNKGVARKLLQEVHNTTGNCLKLIVVRTNNGAKKFYEKVGFHVRYEEESFHINDKDIEILFNKEEK